MPFYDATTTGLAWLASADAPWAAYETEKYAEALGLGEDDAPETPETP